MSVSGCRAAHMASCPFPRYSRMARLEPPCSQYFRVNFCNCVTPRVAMVAMLVWKTWLSRELDPRCETAVNVFLPHNNRGVGIDFGRQPDCRN
eukprot:scaffold3341_cov171-Amphora_coffeaeformis.AAC.1